MFLLNALNKKIGDGNSENKSFYDSDPYDFLA